MQLTNWKRPERRRWKRYTFNSPVRIITDSDVFEARCIRMSAGGIYLFALADLPPEGEIKIEFTADAPESRFSRCGVIRHRALYLYGVEFLAGGSPNLKSMRRPTELVTDAP